MKRILAYRGVIVNSPREAFRLAAREGLITDPECWFDYLGQRNLTSHTYDEEVAEKIFAVLPDFEKDVMAFITTIQAL